MKKVDNRNFFFQPLILGACSDDVPSMLQKSPISVYCHKQHVAMKFLAHLKLRVQSIQTVMINTTIDNTCAKQQNDKKEYKKYNIIIME